MLDPHGFGARRRRPPGKRRLRPIAPPALDQRVIEHRVVVVLAGDDDDLAPGAQMSDPLVVDLGPEPLGVDRGQLVADPVHAASPGATGTVADFATTDRPRR